MEPSPIIKLPVETIRKIAAGEVITRPTNVIKELLENSIDAGAHNIRVIIEKGGLKRIEVIDNGHGIARSNAQLICQRHTTSKLRYASDLKHIGTFGFRGEALASISEVANVEITSFNIQADKMGWSSRYNNGMPSTEIVEKFVQFPGTHIKVTNLFSEIGPRKNSLAASFLDEKKAIVDLITRFTIHFRDKITFILNDPSCGELICSIHPISIGPCIGSFYGMDMESNLFDFSLERDHPTKVHVYLAFSYKKSNSNIHQSNMILFVNDRLVDCEDLRREICALVLEFLSIKQFISVIYIALKIPAHDVDVNTHPAKATVTMHNQEEITSIILSELRAKFQDKLTSQSLPSKFVQQKSIGELMKVTESQSQRLRILAPGCSPQSQPSTQPRRPCNLVHTDHTQLNLSQLTARIPPSRIRRDLKLASIKHLRAKVAEEKSEENAKVLKTSVFVGIFDHHHALIQNETRLYAINFKAFFKELCYQIYLFDFGNFPPIEILPPGNKIQFFIEMYLDDLKKHDHRCWTSLRLNSADDVLAEMLLHKEMFEDYLTLKFTSSEILTLPNIVHDHVPNLVYLGRFFVEMANKVDYAEERACFHRMGRIIADFYSEPPSDLRNISVHRKYHDFINTTLYDAIKRLLLPPEWLFTKEVMCQISDTKDLYKVFERC